MPMISGFKSLAANLENIARKRLGTRRNKRPNIEVGYKANYALAVHEAVEMRLKGKPRSSGIGSYWDPAGKGQAKFLEQPAREHAREIGYRVWLAMKQGSTFEGAMVQGGLMLQHFSEELVPVETGALKESAYTELM